TERFVDVAREDGRREPELAVVQDSNGLVEVLDANQRRRRAEDLLLGDPHLRLDIAEDGRAVEVPLPEAVAGRDLSAGQELRALLPADLRVRVDLLERLPVDDRTDV